MCFSVFVDFGYVVCYVVGHVWDLFGCCYGLILVLVGFLG